MLTNQTRPTTTPWAGFPYVSKYQPGELPSETLARLGLTWEAQTYPIKVTAPDPETGELIDYEVTDKVALMKPIAPGEPLELIDVVSSKYQNLGHNLIVQQLDKIAQQYPVDAIGTTPKGDTLVVVFDRGGESHHGEDHHRWILFSDHLVSKGNHLSGAYFATTAQRLACLNQYPLMRLDQSTLSIRHMGNARGHFMLHSDIIAQLAQIEQQEKLVYERMGKIAYTQTQLEEFLTQVYPDPPEPRNVVVVREALERGVQFQQQHAQALLEVQEQARWWGDTLRRAQAHREQVLAQVEEFNDTFTNQARGTWWAVWNAVTYQVNHTKRHRHQGTSVLYGAGARTMREAYRLIVEAVC